MVNPPLAGYNETNLVFDKEMCKLASYCNDQPKVRFKCQISIEGIAEMRRLGRGRTADESENTPTIQIGYRSAQLVSIQI